MVYLPIFILRNGEVVGGSEILDGENPSIAKRKNTNSVYALHLKNRECPINILASSRDVAEEIGKRYVNFDHIAYVNSYLYLFTDRLFGKIITRDPDYGELEKIASWRGEIVYWPKFILDDNRIVNGERVILGSDPYIAKEKNVQSVYAVNFNNNWEPINILADSRDEAEEIGNQYLNFDHISYVKSCLYLFADKLFERIFSRHLDYGEELASAS